MLASYLVVYVDIKSGKASSPRFFIVFSGTVIFKGIVYSSLFSSSNFCASSIDILKSTPFTWGWTVVGFFDTYASCGSL